MASDDRHSLLRLLPPRRLARRKIQAHFPPPPQRAPQEHARGLRAGAALARQHLATAERVVPTLATEVPYVRLQPAAGMVVTDAEVRALGLVPVLRRADAVLAAYATDRQLKSLENKLGAYAQQTAKHAVLAKLDAIGPWTRQDRTASRLAAITLEPTKAYTVDILLLPVDGATANPNALPTIEHYVLQQQGQVLDRMQAPTLSAVRVRMGGQALGRLLDFRDDVALVDLPPEASVLVPLTLGLDLDQVQEVMPPRPDAPAICVVDSGILEGHPLLEKAIITERSRSYPESLGSPVPVVEASHGTRVAGVALYGDVADCVVQKKFEPASWLINARLLDDNAELAPDRMPFVRGIVENVKDRCRLLNVSIGLTASDGGLSPYAADMDALAREFDMLFVVSAGNRHPADAFPSGEITPPYPEYLLSDGWRVLSPAEALNALTVGGISTDRVPHPAGPGAVAMAPPRAPSPFSRSGGLKNVLKPELVEVAGNLAFDASIRRFSHNAGLGIPTTGPRFATGNLLTFDYGTSISTPKVSHLAARVLDRYPEATANLIRALLVQSAALPAGVDGMERSLAMRLCGFGVPSLDRAIHCAPGRATLYFEGEIDVDDVVMFEVPVPSAVARSKGQKRIIVTVAYDPPVSVLDRARPAGITLTWGLARGDVPEAQVTSKIAAEAEAALAADGEIEREPAKKVFLKGDLPKRIQQRGTVQKNIFSWRRGDHGDPYRLAITAKATRPAHAGAKQRFAVAVTIESEDGTVNVYQTVRARLAAGRVRVRVQD